MKNRGHKKQANRMHHRYAIGKGDCLWRQSLKQLEGETLTCKNENGDGETSGHPVAGYDQG
jgi:hypothetical protein